MYENKRLYYTGRWTTGDFNILSHDRTPMITNDMICLNRCSGQQPPPPTGKSIVKFTGYKGYLSGQVVFDVSLFKSEK